MKHTHVDNRLLAEMNETARLDRLRHILEILEAEDAPHFDFYAHRHP
jgi:hypothetical protein